MNLKILLFTGTLLFSGLLCFAQNSNEFRVYYGTSDAKMIRTEDLDGAGSTEFEKFNEFGLRYLRFISNDFALETGINYSKAQGHVKTAVMGTFWQFRPITVEIISVPLLANYTFLNYFFVNGGPMLNFQLDDTATDSQSGIGYSLGLGGKFYFNDFLIFINPNFKQHALIPFEKEDYHQKLTEFGVQIGVGYQF